MAAVYPLGLDKILGGNVDLDVDTIKVLAVDSGYTYSDTDEFLADIAGGDRLGTATTLTVTYSAGLVSAASINYPGTVATDVIRGLIYYKHTGVEATSALLAFEDRAGGAAMNFVSAGLPIPIAFDNGCFKI